MRPDRGIWAPTSLTGVRVIPLGTPRELDEGDAGAEAEVEHSLPRPHFEQVGRAGLVEIDAIAESQPLRYNIGVTSSEREAVAAVPDRAVARLTEEGLTYDELNEIMDRYAADDADWRHGRTWSLVYNSPAWHRALVHGAASRFSDENALSHAAFPSVARFESAVVSMVASVVSPGVPAHGIFTSGGTESVLVALKAYRDRTRRHHGTVVVPATAHPAFGKAAAYLGLALVTVPVGRDGLPSAAALVDAVDERTVVVGLSAPCYPFGVVDPIAEVGAALAGRGVGIHVDSALGGLFLPFLELDGRPAFSFGIEVPGVTSVSVDVHKYGYSSKGASVVLFADPALRHAAYHVSLEWPGGAYRVGRGARDTVRRWRGCCVHGDDFTRAEGLPGTGGAGHGDRADNSVCAGRTGRIRVGGRPTHERLRGFVGAGGGRDARPGTAAPGLVDRRPGGSSVAPLHRLPSAFRGRREVSRRRRSGASGPSRWPRRRGGSSVLWCGGQGSRGDHA